MDPFNSGEIQAVSADFARNSPVFAAAGGDENSGFQPDEN
jgi:hypothetical protein